MVRHGALYQWLLRLYPATFRREFGEDMVQVFTDRLRDEAGRARRAAPARVWLHTLRDLSVSVPLQHKEQFMFSQRATPVQVAAVAAVALAAIVAAAAAGPFALIPFLAAAGWLAYQERRAQYVQVPRSPWQRWVMWGVALLAVAWVPALAWLELSEWAWLVMMLMTFAAAVVVVIGLAMGFRDRPRGPVKPA